MHGAVARILTEWAAMAASVPREGSRVGRQYGAGDVIAGRFVLKEKLGSGGMGTVWRAHHLLLNKDFALKHLLLPTDGVAGVPQDRLARALREGNTLAKLDPHPGIVSVNDLMMVDEIPWLVMDLVEGRSLKQIVSGDRRPLAEDRVIDLALQLLEALTRVHRQGVLHRDIKPDNILITADGHAKLVDFGIAVHADDTMVTRSGELVGTPGYVDPERLRGQHAVEASDLFSLAATLYFAMVGRGPFARDNQAATLYATVNERPLFPPGAGPLRELIEQLLAPDAADRPSAEAALSRLRALRASTTTGDTASPSVDGTEADSGAAETAGDTSPGARSVPEPADVSTTSPTTFAIPGDAAAAVTEPSNGPSRWPTVALSALGAVAFLLPLTLGMGIALGAHASYLIGAYLIPLSITAVLTIAGIAISRFEEELVRPLVAAALTNVLGLPLGLIMGAFAGDPFAWAVIGSAISGALGVFIGTRVFDPDSSESWATSVIAALAIATLWIVGFEIMGGLTQHWAPHSAAGFLNGWARALVRLLG